MIVTACDICRKLMESGFMFIASRSGETVAFSKKTSAGKAVSHLCSKECAVTFFERWMSDDLPELPKVETPANARSHVVTGVRDPTPQEIANQNDALGVVLGGRY